MGKCTPRFALFVLILGAVSLLPANGLALDLGLTPSHVYSLWTNTNKCLRELANRISDDAEWRRQFATTPVKTFERKKPSDVLEHLTIVRAKVDRLRQKAGLPPVERYGGGTEEITPSVVYLNSGHLLDGLVDLLIRTSGPDQLVSQFFIRTKFLEKTPSDVFGLVDVADRRLDQMLARAGL